VGKLFLLFTAVPLLDLWLLLAIGDVIGFWPTLGLVLLTGFAGATLARLEGLRVLGAWRAALAAGRLPEEGVLSGVLVLVGAVLLVTPGVVTDVVGLALLVPASRRLAARGLRAWLARQIRSGRVRVVSGVGARGHPGRPPASREVVDVTPRTRDETP
jgi:UPF0716 protein FxsA